MSDRWAVAAAVAAAIGALRPSAPLLLAGAGAAVISLVVGPHARPAFLCLAVGLAASGLAQRSLDGLDGVQEASVVGNVTLLSDPTPSFGGFRMDVRLGHRRLEARADGSARAAIADRLAGEVVRVHATLTPAPARPWLTARHVAGRLTLLRVDGWHAGDPVSRLANDLRRTLVAGTRSLDERQRSLFTGLVIGDDRHQAADVTDQFLGAGLTHLLAVSGENVAFVLVMVGPVLRRLRLWPRLLTTLAVVGFFGVMTRVEPSVLRASAMAALAAVLAVGGHPSSRVRVMALAVTGLLLIDPLLVRSVGFGLSLSAAVAIVVVAPRLVPVLPGPRALREGLAVTVAAQLGVAPFLLSSFGPIPVASVPANLLAVPVAGAVMIWGLTAGLAAGVAGGTQLAWLLHVPTRVALAWLELVARRAAAAPLGALGPWSVAAIAAGLTMVVLAQGSTSRRRHGWAIVMVVLLASAVAARAPAPLRSSLGVGLVRWHQGGTDVVVLGGVGGRTTLAPAAVLEALRRAGVGAIDLLVVGDASVPAALVHDVERAHPTGTTLVQRAALPDAPVGSVVRADARGGSVELGRLTVRVVVVPDRLVVDCLPRAG